MGKWDTEVMLAGFSLAMVAMGIKWGLMLAGAV